MSEGGGEDRRQSVVCAVAILHEERGILIGVIEVGLYLKLS